MNVGQVILCGLVQVHPPLVVYPGVYWLRADDIKINDKLRTKVERHYVVAESLAEYYKVAMKLDKPLIEYARYVVTKGNFEEKSGLAKGIQNKFVIKKGVLTLIG